MMAVDLDGVFYACRAVLPGMIRQKYGRIRAHQQHVGPDRRQLRGSTTALPKAGADRPGPSALAKEEGPSGVTVNMHRARSH